MPELTHDDAVVNGVRLHYVEAGDGPLVVLLHGFPEFWYSWREQIPTLAEVGFRVVAPDMRGYNTSEKPRGVEQYRPDELVRDVVALVNYFDEETAYVVGHDWGGLVAWEVAIRHPERIERLAVLNAPHPGRYREAIRSPEQLLRSWYALFFQLPKLPEFLLSARDYAVFKGMLRGSTENPDAFTEEDIRRYIQATDRPGGLTAPIDYYRAAFRENAREELRALLDGARHSFDVRVPTLLIWGERDPALGIELTEGLERWVSDIRVERLPDAGHGVQNDRPDCVNELLMEFLRE